MIYFLVTGEAFPQYKHLLIEINPRRVMPTISVLEKWKDDLKMLMLHYVLNITKYTSDELEENYYDNTPEWREWCDNLLYFYCCRYVMDGRQIPMSLRKEPEDEEPKKQEPPKDDEPKDEEPKDDDQVSKEDKGINKEPAKRGRKPKPEEKVPSKRGRKPKDEDQLSKEDKGVNKEPAKRGRKPKEPKPEEKVPAKRGRKPKSENVDEKE